MTVTAHKALGPWAGDVRCCPHQARSRGPILLCPHAGFRAGGGRAGHLLPAVVWMAALRSSVLADLCAPGKEPSPTFPWGAAPSHPSLPPSPTSTSPGSAAAEASQCAQPGSSIPSALRPTWMWGTMAWHGTASVSPHMLPWKWAGAALMETRPAMMALAPSEVSPGPPLCHGVLWATCVAPCARGTGGE